MRDVQNRQPVLNADRGFAIRQFMTRSLGVAAAAAMMISLTPSARAVSADQSRRGTRSQAGERRAAHAGPASRWTRRRWRRRFPRRWRRRSRLSWRRRRRISWRRHAGVSGWRWRRRLPGRSAGVPWREAVSVRARPLSAAVSGVAPYSMAAAIDTRAPLIARRPYYAPTRYLRRAPLRLSPPFPASILRLCAELLLRPRYYQPRRFCRVVWTYYGPRKICRYRFWHHRHWHYRRHHHRFNIFIGEMGRVDWSDSPHSVMAGA